MLQHILVVIVYYSIVFYTKVNSDTNIRIVMVYYSIVSDDYGYTHSHRIRMRSILLHTVLLALAMFACFDCGQHDLLRIMNNRTCPYSLAWLLGLPGCSRCSDGYSVL